MVAAGVFLVARVYPLMEAAPANAPQGPSVQVNAVASPRAEPALTAATREQTLTPALALSEREREKRRLYRDGSERAGSSATPQKTDGQVMILHFPKGEGRGQGERTQEKSANVSSALKAVTWVGAITALFAALIAVAQTDIKRILAYSTVSQLGFMFMGLGVGGVAVGMFHLITHAFFKALLFLGAGSVIHGCDGEQDIRRMGGLRRFMPITFATYAVGMMALSGVPLVFSGFWSKDEIIYTALKWDPSRWPFLLGLLGAFLTAFYMTRQICYVFVGTNRAATAPGPSAIPPSPTAPQTEIAS